MKIGQFVRLVAPQILDYCALEDPGELRRLQDPGYSKQTFDVNFPFCLPIGRIGTDLHHRYFVQSHHAAGSDWRVTSQWFNPPKSDSLALLRAYLAKRGLAQPLGGDDLSRQTPRPPRARGRWKASAIGNAQNLFVRNLLGRLGDECFSESDWRRIVSEFGDACAYCGAKEGLLMDHIVPINSTALGEHRLGNLVPSCRPCNARKGDKDFRVFLAANPAAIARIEAHMAHHGYQPQTSNSELRRLLQEAQDAVRELAGRYEAKARDLMTRQAED